MDAPINSRPVCRFYLPSLAAHFYTGLANEYARFKADPFFEFEGDDFAALPVGAGSCDAGTSPVFRTCNNGASRRVTVNHFYSTNAGLADDLIASSGWNKEGAVFCVPGLPETEKTVVVAGRQGIYSDATSSVATGTGPVLGPRSGTGDFSQWNDPAHMAGFAGG